MKLIKDLGMQYPNPTSKQKQRYGLYECPDCLKHFKVNSYNVKYNNQQTCASCRGTRLKTTHGMTGTTSYNAWKNMMSRCYDIRNSHYDRYGSRGITVCKEWHDFKVYNVWFQNTHIDGLTMDRTNNDMGYEPTNVEWKSMAHQAQNTTLLRKGNTLGYRGVKIQRTKTKKKGNIVKYIANICVNRKQIHIGIFKEPRQAAIARDEYVIANGLNHTLNNLKELR